jgi:DNA-binding CsgD family transcriptional regulator
MQSAIFGRDAELASLADFVAGISDGAAALVLEGEAGMGKTTLWEAGVEDAGERGLLVLRARAAEGEVALSFSGLGDLLDPVLDDALAPLPSAQRGALSRALLLGDDQGPVPDSHAVGVAVLNALRGLSADRALVVAVDDAHWLDTASAGALMYAARRLRDELVGVLLARRTSLESLLAAELRRSLPPGRFSELAVGPLDPSALHQVVQGDLGVALARPLLVEVHGASGGNPFYALEIVRTLRREGVSVEAGQPLPVPESLHDLVHDRLLALPPESRDFLLAAAAHANPTVTVAEQATGVDRRAGLGPALEAGIVELDGARVLFTHPLLAAGAYETADPLRRADVHARLAELLEDPEARARHLAAATIEPEQTVANAIDDGAARAITRGAPRAGALLYERAAALTPRSDDGARRRRIVEAAYAHHASGDTERARGLLEPALQRAVPGRELAGLLIALARVRSYDDEIRSASDLYRQALLQAEDGSLVQAYAQEGLGGTLFRLRERLAEAAEVAAAAAATAHRLGATQLEAEALATKAVAAAALGLPEAVDAASAALDLQPACLHRPALRQPLFAATCVHFWHDDLVGAHAAYQTMVTSAVELGDESSLPYTYVMLAQIDCARGRFADAVDEAETGRVIAEQATQRALIAYTLAVRAVAQAHLGRVDEADGSARAAMELAEMTSGIPAWIFASWALGHLALSQGQPASAFDAVRPLVEHHRREAIDEPGALPFLPDAVEALVDAGRLEEAEELLTWYRASAERLGRKRGRAAAYRVGGLLAGACGDLERAQRELISSVELYSEGDTPFERGRALLALGAVQRRAKRRRESRQTLEEALVVFEGLGAAIWAERARAELKRISGRAPAPWALTPAEERVATLVAEGRTNREVAAALYLSDRTVEGHLSHIFGKLGIRHRAELARALDARESGVEPPSNVGESPVSAPRATS